ncbi:sugar phosphate isomerase/epimerase [Paracoccus bogoriensis]|uniref:sugar phosphate isomerase/epimerase family protein n=1 Tax=Paracoccus bogoriensis TaxID=242065 RepID=UPI001C67E617|nr:sugar phosphate isomerase/epimerase family protein [Paracoccus bogoriensis]MBW7056034.1 sugar phosphate isomerase/epimerase [Paracoccus bogoriensis]
MSLPLLGVALTHPDFDGLRDWICAPGRAVEIQDFCALDAIRDVRDDLIAAWAALRDDLTGPVGIHGPFLGLDIGNPDGEIRAIVQKRLLEGIEIALALRADQMVVHSPFTYWQHLNRENYPMIRPAIFEAAADCLAPVLARATEAGCQIVLENIDDADPTVRVDLVAAIDHPLLAVSLDTGHAELAHGRYGAPPVVDYIAAARGRLAHVHLQDADGYADRHWHPGDGRIPWRPVLDAIAALPDRPRLILEVNDDLPRLPDTVARLEALGLAR